MPAHYQNLVSVPLLADHYGDPDWVVLDCRFDLTDPSAGRNAWQAGHVPGAVFADLERDLSAPASQQAGRHPLPDPTALGQRLSEWGVDAGTQVVAYDDAGGAYAARAWWLLRWLGHLHVAVLDGGFDAWRRSGQPVDSKPPVRTTRQFNPRPRHEMHIDADGVADALERGCILLDARAAERFLGEVEPLDARAGHIPGAHNHPFPVNLDRDGQFLSAAELRSLYDAAACGRPPTEVISMCGSGVTACHNLLAMQIAGLSGARLYPGSWSQWSADDSRPVAQGPDV